jgi:threonine/homoserine/homoserine lactone efflux protein
MPSFETLVAFFGVSVLLCVSPGPDNLFVLLQSAMHGRRAGLLIVAGLCTGLIVHTSAVALGLAAVFAASETAFAVLKIVGALYLAWLAWQAFRAPVETLPVGQARTGAARMYRRGVFMNITNPKVGIFFLAFLPQFVDPALGAVSVQVFWLGLTFIVATFLVFGAIACFAGVIGGFLKASARAQRVLNRVAGCVFLALAVRLALAQR